MIHIDLWIMCERCLVNKYHKEEKKCFRNYNNNNNNCIQLGKVSIETLKTNKYRNGRKPAFSRSYAMCAIELN